MFSLFLNYKLFWMNNIYNNIIEFSFRIIWRIMEILKGVICQGRTLLDIYNSSDDTQPHSLIANYMVQPNTETQLHKWQAKLKQNPRLCPNKNKESPVLRACEIQGALHRFKTLTFPSHPTATHKEPGATRYMHC